MGTDIGLVKLTRLLRMLRKFFNTLLHSDKYGHHPPAKTYLPTSVVLLQCASSLAHTYTTCLHRCGSVSIYRLLLIGIHARCTRHGCSSSLRAHTTLPQVSLSMHRRHDCQSDPDSQGVLCYSDRRGTRPNSSLDSVYREVC